MKLYVASGFHNYVNARSMIDRLLDAGHSITFDWTRTDQFDQITGELVSTSEHHLPLARQRELLHDDMNGALFADATVLLHCADMAGAYIEVGLALSANKQVYVVGSPRWTLFWAHQNVVRFQNINAFYRYLDA